MTERKVKNLRTASIRSSRQNVRTRLATWFQVREIRHPSHAMMMFLTGVITSSKRSLPLPLCSALLSTQLTTEAGPAISYIG